MTLIKSQAKHYEAFIIEFYRLRILRGRYCSRSFLGAIMKKYTVWVGDVEVNDYLLTLEQAKILADKYIDDDYDDVIIEAIE